MGETNIYKHSNHRSSDEEVNEQTKHSPERQLTKHFLFELWNYFWISHNKWQQQTNCTLKHGMRIGDEEEDEEKEGKYDDDIEKQ